MAKPYTLPVVGPLYAAVPYHYKNVRKVSVFCRCNEDMLARFLPEDFEVATNLIEIFIMESPDAGALGTYNEGGVVIPIRYKGKVGGHVALEYVDNDDSMAVGREIWGYPKKLADCPMAFADDGTVTGKIVRRGIDLVSIAFKPSETSFEKPVLQPRYQIKTFPCAAGGDTDLYQVIHNQVTDFVIHNAQTGTATLEVKSSGQDPLEQLGIQEIVGAELSKYDFVLGYGDIIEGMLPTVD